MTRERISLCMSGLPSFVGEEAYYVARNSGATRDQAKLVVDRIWEGCNRRFPDVTLVELFLTDACNLACPYCFVHEKWHHRNMSRETMEDATHLLMRESGDARSVSLVLMGGEPMLRYQDLVGFLPWAHEQAKQGGKKLRIDMTSNGTLITDDKAEYLASQGVKVLLSIDGDRATHDHHRPTRSGAGSFDEAMRGLGALKRHQGFVGTKMTIAQDQVDNLVGNVAALAERGVDYFMMGHATGSHWTADQAEALANAYIGVYQWWADLPQERRPRFKMIDDALSETGGGKRHAYGCRAGRSGLVVTPERDLFPCSKMLGANASEGILKLGTLDGGITEIETRKQLNGFGAMDRPACWNCRMQTKCLGGCYAVNHTLTGDPFTPGSDCSVVSFVHWSKQEIQRRHRAQSKKNAGSEEQQHVR